MQREGARHPNVHAMTANCLNKFESDITSTGGVTVGDE